MTGETSCCPPRGFANAEERILRIRKDPDLVSFSLGAGRGEAGRGKVSRRSPGMGKSAGESRSEREMHGSERGSQMQAYERARARERASELYWERLDAVWPSVTTRLRRSPER